MHQKKRTLHNGIQDGLTPTTSLDLSKASSLNTLVSQMKDTAFTGRALGEAADVLYDMVMDPDCFVVGTFSGAMTVAKMGLVLCDMIDHGMLGCLVSTGAFMTHGLIESVGMTHFKYDHAMDDAALYEAGYDRVYDTLELEQNLDDLEIVVQKVLSTITDRASRFSSYQLCDYLGAYLNDHAPGRGILKSARSKSVPVFIPAFTDSELGLDVALYNRRCREKGEEEIVFDPFLDLDAYTEIIRSKKKLGIFTIGGGVPRNWAQQVAPYLDLINKRLGAGGAFKRFYYAVRICPEPAHWGGLSGCTYAEGISWGKFVPPKEGGRFAEVPVDATVGWPLIVGAVLERLKK